MQILKKSFDEFSRLLDVFPPFKMGDVETKLPIIQGGMGVGVSRKKLASAVTLAGGIGTIASVGLGHKKYRELKKRETDNRTLTYERKGQIFAEINKAALINEIKETRALVGNRPIAVNIMCALSDYDHLVAGAVEAGADIIISGAGVPKELPGLVGKSKIKLIPIVSSWLIAQTILSHWEKNYSRRPDAILLEGPMAGGHLGYRKKDILPMEEDPDMDSPYKLKRLIEKLKSKIPADIPVIAAGGIFTGKDILDALSYGANAVQMATRFVATAECDAHDNFKHVFVNAKGTQLISSPVGLPGRAAHLPKLPQPFKCEYKCLKTCDAPSVGFCIADLLVNSAYEGDIEHGLVFAGSNVSKINAADVLDVNGNFITVSELMKRIRAEGFIYNLNTMSSALNSSVEHFISDAQKSLSDFQTSLRHQVNLDQFCLDCRNRIDQLKNTFQRFKEKPSSTDLCDLGDKMRLLVDRFTMKMGMA